MELRLGHTKNDQEVADEGGGKWSVKERQNEKVRRVRWKVKARIRNNFSSVLRKTDGHSHTRVVVGRRLLDSCWFLLNWLSRIALSSERCGTAISAQCRGPSIGWGALNDQANFRGWTTRMKEQNEEKDREKRISYKSRRLTVRTCASQKVRLCVSA